MAKIMARVGVRMVCDKRRRWAVDVDGELLAVTVYRKGAIAIADLLMSTRLVSMFRIRE